MMPMELLSNGPRQLTPRGLLYAAAWARWGGVLEPLIVRSLLVAQLLLTGVVAHALWRHGQPWWVILGLSSTGLVGGLLVVVLISAGVFDWEIEPSLPLQLHERCRRDVWWALEAWERMPIDEPVPPVPAWIRSTAAWLSQVPDLTGLGAWWHLAHQSRRSVSGMLARRMASVIETQTGKRTARSATVQSLYGAVRSSPACGNTPIWHDVFARHQTLQERRALTHFLLRFAPPVWWASLDTVGRRWVLQIHDPMQRVAALAAISEARPAPTGEGQAGGAQGESPVGGGGVPLQEV